MFLRLVTIAGCGSFLWLNECFASWMQNNPTERFHPDWQVLREHSVRMQSPD